MARLRIGIMADQAPVPDPKDGPPADLVFRFQGAHAKPAKTHEVEKPQSHDRWLQFEFIPVPPQSLNRKSLRYPLLIA
jgi:hypothetical protein